MIESSFYALLGSLGVGFLLLYLANFFYKNHVKDNSTADTGILQIFVLVLITASIFQVGVASKAVLDLDETCTIEKVNDTSLYSETEGDYARICFDSTHTTNTQNYWVTMTFATLGMMLLLVHIVKSILTFYNRNIRRRK